MDRVFSKVEVEVVVVVNQFNRNFPFLSEFISSSLNIPEAIFVD